ncbi:MAG: threonine-phosphate decarboxylase CobD [Hyphomicrobium sp.]
MKVASIVMPPFDPDAMPAEFIEHGGRISAARAFYRGAPEPWLDLSTGISPWSYPIPKLPVECWTRLPDPADVVRLAADARRRYGAPDTAQIFPVAGTDLSIALLPRLVLGARRVAIVAPTYGAHERAWTAAGHDVSLVADLEGLVDCDIGVVVNPNNPDGRRWSRAQIQKTATRLGRSGALLIVDEAFADVAPGVSMLAPDADLSNAIIFRSFGKFYGLAGVRLGFVISAHPDAASLAKTMSDWPVSGPAIAIGCAALADDAWAAAAVPRLDRAAQRLDAALEQLGMTILGGTGLFRLATHPAGWRVFDRLAQHGVLTRPVRANGAIRFGVPGSDAELARVTAALATLRFEA